ncbi:EmrB/QacA subfamily drug resistance transporter [Terracoccus luteus]|uniref:EmrB/QacA subfamily drug resistance transporter n=1 Tax=Terracoccus luteus TaxID=53356 RepID=A0A495XYL1_9MICO|nr:DHA2 family efflux MFS transporter permease subunit [Terracoccus luteus]RKT79701.1 EmrB/QacA subfamily drug resistance transporter [Terracoccus luteus]
MTTDSRPDAGQPGGRGGERRRWFGLVAISVAVALIIVDSTIVNVAIPNIVGELSLTSSQVQWVQESYTLVFAATLLIWGSVADRIGRRRMLLIGVVVFVLASGLAAVAGSGGALIGARVVQGFGGAMILPTTLSLINAGFTGRDRGIAFAVWGSTIGGMVAVGPLLGGWLTTSFSWRWAFGINLPLGILIVAGVLLFVDESRSRAKERIDLVGAALSAVTFATLAFGLIEGRTYGWWSLRRPFEVGDAAWTWSISPVVVAFAVTFVAGAVFVARTLRRTRRGLPTLFRFDLFSITSFRNGNIAAMIVSLGEFGIVLSLPLWLQNVLGYSAFQTGLVLLALAIGSFAASGLSASVLSRTMTPAAVVRIGIVAEIVGVAGLGLVIGPSTSWLAVTPFLFVYGFGVGLATAQLTGVVLVDVPLQRSGEGSGLQSTARQIGSALGIAVLGTVLFTTAGARLESGLTDAGVPATAQTQVVDAVVESSGGAIAGLAADPATAPAATVARQAFSDATQAAAFTAAGFLVLGLLASLSLGGSSAAPAGRGREDEKAGVRTT